ncbi:MAG: hypothetical protein N3C12_08025 [Candidatus Binatia bacterium]|nr:hypothetical protein [Candidatus Binatia bacterium]
MPESQFIVQKVDWYQLRTAEGEPILIMVASLPNGFYTAVPCRLAMTLATHEHMAIGSSIDEALSQLQKTLAGKAIDAIFAHR